VIPLLLLQIPKSEVIQVDQKLMVFVIAGVFLLIVVPGAVNIIHLVVQIFTNLRRKPPLSEELLTLKMEVAKTFATKHDLAEVNNRFDAAFVRVHAELRDSLTEINQKVEDLSKSVNNSTAGIERALGRLEGMIKKG